MSVRQRFNSGGSGGGGINSITVGVHASAASTSAFDSSSSPRSSFLPHHSPTSSPSSSSAAGSVAAPPAVSSLSMASSASRPLAQVEWQLCMRMCDCPSLLALARCSHDTLRAASSEFAWSALSPVTFRSTHPGFIEGVSRPGSLLRFADLGLRWCHPQRPPYCQPIVNASELAVVASVPRLKMLDTRARAGFQSAQSDSWLQMLTEPLKNLTALYAGHGALSPHSLQLLRIHCPTLRTLHVVSWGYPAGEFIGELVRIEGLTDLGLSIDLSPADLTLLCAYSGLLQLTIHGCHTDAWQPLLTSPNLQSLQQLTIENATAVAGHAISEPTAMRAATLDWVACFSNLLSLQILILEKCGAIDALLPIIAAHAPASLRSLCISVPGDALTPLTSRRWFSFTYSSGPPAPSAHALKQLLQQRASIDIAIQIESVEAYLEALANASNEASSSEAQAVSEWEGARSEYASLQSLHPTRVRLLISSPPPPLLPIVEEIPLAATDNDTSEWTGPMGGGDDSGEEDY